MVLAGDRGGAPIYLRLHDSHIHCTLPSLSPPSYIICGHMILTLTTPSPVIPPSPGSILCTKGSTHVDIHLISCSIGKAHQSKNCNAIIFQRSQLGRSQTA